VWARGTQRQPLCCCRGCKLGSEGDGLSRTTQRYPASRSRTAMRAATRWGSSLEACLSAEVVTGSTAIRDCTTASFRYERQHLEGPSSFVPYYRVSNDLVVTQSTPNPMYRMSNDGCDEGTPNPTHVRRHGHCAVMCMRAQGDR